jgi:hypothetical protein
MVIALPLFFLPLGIGTGQASAVKGEGLSGASFKTSDEAHVQRRPGLNRKDTKARRERDTARGPER